MRLCSSFVAYLHVDERRPQQNGPMVSQPWTALLTGLALPGQIFPSTISGLFLRRFNAFQPQLLLASPARAAAAWGRGGISSLSPVSGGWMTLQPTTLLAAKSFESELSRSDLARFEAPPTKSSGRRPSHLPGNPRRLVKNSSVQPEHKSRSRCDVAPPPLTA